MAESTTDKEHEKILQWLRDCEASTPESEYRKKAIESYEFYAGTQDTKEVIELLESQNRPYPVFNETKPKVDMLVGMAAQAPTTSVAVPVGAEDEALTEVMNGVLFHYQKKLEITRKRNKCFEHTCKSGRSLHWFWIDDSNPFKYAIKSKRWRGDQFYLDPNAVTMNLTNDGGHRFIFLEKWVSEEELARRVPKGHDVEELKDTATGTDGLSFWNEARDLYRLMECWYFKLLETYWFINPISGREEGLIKEDFQNFKKAVIQGIPLDQQGQQLFQMTPKQFQEWEASSVKKSFKKWVYYTIFSGGIVIVREKSPLNWDGFPGILYGAYKDDNNNTWLSVIETIKDPQRSLNTLMRQLVYLLQTLPKGILLHETGAIIDIERYEQHSAEPNFHMEVARGMIEKVKFQTQGAISQVYQQLIGIFLNAIKSASGIHDDLMGIETSSREATSTLRARQQTSFAVLYVLFDNFRISRFRETKLLLTLIQQYVTEPEWIRITGQKGIQVMQINSQINPGSQGFNDVTAIEYDIEADEITETTSIRMMIAALLAEFAHNNPNTIPPTVMLEYMNIPFSVKQQVQAYWEQQQQLQQEQADREYKLELLKLGAQTDANKQKTKEKTNDRSSRSKD